MTVSLGAQALLCGGRAGLNEGGSCPAAGVGRLQTGDCVDGRNESAALVFHQADETRGGSDLWSGEGTGEWSCADSVHEEDS